MRDLNKQLFDEYQNDTYFKFNEQAEKQFRSILKFPNTLGFDNRSFGFIVLHKRHKPSGIEDEIPACLILKRLGFCIELVEEHDSYPSQDVKIGQAQFEIKRLHNCTDWGNGILRHFRRSYKKTSHLILHIDQQIYPYNLKRAIRNAAIQYKNIQVVWLIYHSNLTILNRDMILDAKYEI
jgi:hypothetical protein